MNALPPKPSKRLLTRSLALRLLPLLALALINLLFLAMLDSLFANKKRALIIDDRERFDEMLEETQFLKDSLERLRSRPSDYPQRARNLLEGGVAEEFLHGDHPWFRIVLDAHGDLPPAVYEAPEKLRRWNRYENCLFSRSFHAPAASPSLMLTVHYATPQGWPSIEAMVTRYRFYAVLFVLITCLIYIWLDRMILRPLLRVGGAIERMIQPGQAALIPEANHDIERACNRLARIQREVFFGFKIEGIVSGLHAQSDDHEALERFLREASQAICDVYPFQQVEIEPAQSGEEGAIAREGDDTLIPMRTGGSERARLRCRLEPECWASPDELRAIGEEIQKQCENGLARALTRSRALTEERNRFGINLATNMGHDLTNIIASGKWDLDTIQRAISLGIVQLDPERGGFFEEAVKGLKNNLYFLQEMVNIYRSFGYIRKPRFEQMDAGVLAREIAEIFRLSTSQRFRMRVDAPECLEMNAEPRLLRMALFNLMANAAQAMQRCEPPIQDGEIVLSVHTDRDRVIFRVSDNGPGIRGNENELLAPTEIDRIFQSGYTTKDGASGGGLGLAWVKSITQDFHGGGIGAYNREGGGACFELSIPLNGERVTDPAGVSASPIRS